MSAVLYLLLSLSGAAALHFETLWFNQAGLALGKPVWASSIGIPPLGPVLAPVLGPILDRPLLANGIRPGVAFALLLVPSPAMRVTLPGEPADRSALVYAIHAHCMAGDPARGRALAARSGLAASRIGADVESWRLLERRCGETAQQTAMPGPS